MRMGEELRTFGAIKIMLYVSNVFLGVKNKRVLYDSAVYQWSCLERICVNGTNDGMNV